MNEQSSEINTVAPTGAEPHLTVNSVPKKFGRYRVERLLGRGGFGEVYLGGDDQLGRQIAIKVPRRERLGSQQDIDAYLFEARILAGLDHPHIVPVYDVGTEDGSCFVVSKFIEGSNLSSRIQRHRFAFREAAELVAAIAEALHHAHKSGLVHRDVKPGNILLDTSGRVYLADFGLAMKEEELDKGDLSGGTPPYMSPEHALGEGHRVEARSDLFSLGIVFYQVLTGQRPFRSDSIAEVLHKIVHVEARPPRQIDDAIPRELERICLKAMSKKLSDRYTTGRDMADDLRYFLTGAEKAESRRTQGAQESRVWLDERVQLDASVTPPDSDRNLVKVVPKGLRSFDAGDADFFLELLPGARDREGLPESIHFWKTRIEQKDPDSAFTVGLLYGPSGCGKSSLVKAGLLPRLAKHVVAVYVEATPKETEARLVKGLRKHFPELAGRAGLAECLAALRRGGSLLEKKKVVIILDQFEQWLHGQAKEETAELVKALRQCDGAHVQAVIMVRDDFWLAVSRFFAELEVPLLQGQNTALVDLFDLPHARKVLTLIGRAYERLPDKLNQEQQDFLDQAATGLAQEDKVISVRLALFAAMLKGKPWTPATLKEVGGMHGVGATFLEETFAARNAEPRHRLHLKAVQEVLRALLPDSGSDIKGNMSAHAELLAASGYASRPRDFDDLLRILDGELRLVTPTELEYAGEPGQGPGEPGGVSPRSSDARYYQLTHDYLVPSLCDWLTRKQKETRRGRAELLLADRAAVWSARPENRQMPTLWQWLTIRWLTARKNWTPPQRTMMAKAARHHAMRGVALAVLLTLVGWGAYEAHGNVKAHGLRDRLLDASTSDVLDIVADMAPYRRWVDPLLNEASQDTQAKHDARRQLHVSVALAPVDPSQVEYLYDRLLDAEAHEVGIIRTALAPHKEALVPKLWQIATGPTTNKDSHQPAAPARDSRRLRATCVLAVYDKDGANWEKVAAPVVDQLVAEHPVYLSHWLDGFRPVALQLVPPLAKVFRDRRDERATDRAVATNLLAEYAAAQPDVLADLLMDADEKQFAVLFERLEKHGAGGLAFVHGELAKMAGAAPAIEQVDAEAPERKEHLAKRQANAAVALLRMNQTDKVWPLLKHSPDPRVRSYLIHRFGPLGADVGAIVKRLDEETDISIRRALILSLGEFAEQPGLVSKIQEVFRTAEDPGLHAAAEWLLRHWKQEVWLRETQTAWAKHKDARLQTIKLALEKSNRGVSAPAVPAPKLTPQWYVNGQAQTMVVIPGPVEFLMGSPAHEKSRIDNEIQHRKRIGRSFAVAAKSVTVAEYRRFDNGYSFIERFAPMPDCPAVSTSWYQAAEYCNWLSDQEGIDRDQWCYETNAQGRVTKLREGYLSLAGYRLPSEAEMEFVCRAGAATARYYGESAELLGKYAWFLQNSGEHTWPVGNKKPNDFGFFDLHGNVWNRCQENYLRYQVNAGVTDDLEGSLSINGQDLRVLRGGSVSNLSPFVRCSTRNGLALATRVFDIGFRPARTIEGSKELNLMAPE